MVHVGRSSKGRLSGEGKVGMLVRDSYRVDEVYELGQGLESVWAKISGEG